jgi:EAL domain-containing protein (putative c-di-GMP-specific phosphodiesterase class I)
MDAQAMERATLEADLHRGLQLGQFELYFQPKADIGSDEVRGAEALIRWNHPERGVVAPAQFIPLAEECGLINDIGGWVLHEACNQCQAWQRAGLPPMRVAVNVSGSQFHRGDLLEQVRSALTLASLDPCWLEIEVTESAVMTDPEESAAILEQLSRMGVLVSVDDFGTGYSSMSYLRRFPIDKLKIDRGFIQELIQRSDDALIVRAIISLAHGLRLKVVAEGVETAEQLKLLQQLGCDQYQGYQFSQPLPAAQFAELIRGIQGRAERSAQDESARTHSKLVALR